MRRVGIGLQLRGAMRWHSREFPPQPQGRVRVYPAHTKGRPMVLRSLQLFGAAALVSLAFYIGWTVLAR
jgi:hypothetical protein